MMMWGRRQITLGLLATALVASPGNIACAQTEAELERLRARALELVNATRRGRGLAPLKPDSGLNQAAQAHARDMLRRRYLEHETPAGETMEDRYGRALGGRWRSIGENISSCSGCVPPLDDSTVEAMHRDWMESPGHRDNILDDEVTLFGYGLAAASGRLYAVQAFAQSGRQRRKQQAK